MQDDLAVQKYLVQAKVAAALHHVSAAAVDGESEHDVAAPVVTVEIDVVGVVDEIAVGLKIDLELACTVVVGRAAECAYDSVLAVPWETLLGPTEVALDD